MKNSNGVLLPVTARLIRLPTIQTASPTAILIDLRLMIVLKMPDTTPDTIPAAMVKTTGFSLVCAIKWRYFFSSRCFFEQQKAIKDITFLKDC
jgi:hypothetical protein